MGFPMVSLQQLNRANEIVQESLLPTRLKNTLMEGHLRVCSSKHLLLDFGWDFWIWNFVISEETMQNVCWVLVLRLGSIDLWGCWICPTWKKRRIMKALSLAFFLFCYGHRTFQSYEYPSTTIIQNFMIRIFLTESGLNLDTNVQSWHPIKVGKWSILFLYLIFFILIYL